MNRFEHHPIRTAVWIVIAIAVVALAAIELSLRSQGFGDPVLYEAHPDFGYRPRPSQSVRRFDGAVVRINNLRIRALDDWQSPARKIVFLGDSVTYGGSYVSTSDLFAVRAAPDGWTGGSAGVNAWGVGNIHGLIVRHRFLPAQVYVTVLIEDDFYRGFSERPSFFRLSKPVLALEEIVPHALLTAKAYLRRMAPQRSVEAGSRPRRRATAEQSVGQLAELDTFLRSRGFVHLMYLSPSRANLGGGVPPDPAVAEALERSSLRVIRLQDDQLLSKIDAAEVAALYHDVVHLTRRGHDVWARIIKRDLQEAIASLQATNGPRGKQEAADREKRP
jgi:hypothetical protein